MYMYLYMYRKQFGNFYHFILEVEFISASAFLSR